MRRSVGLVLSVILLGGCNDAEQGERIGLFSVLATRTQNSCGAQLSGKRSSARFNVVLSLQQGVLRWTPEGASTATGTFDVYPGTFRISLEESSERIAPDRRREIAGCVLRRVDVIEGSLRAVADAGVQSDPDAGSRVVGFTAQETIAYGVESGDCGALLGVGQGQALALPCVVGYQLDATRVGP